ncbi:MAG TPA: enoyl-CoA hydratase/isomerase family protein [Turneriella sp.]|nr:enoyl-CoA hydratase/isomerase family protein [Turneriella sp.]
MALELKKENRVALVKINHNPANTLTHDSFAAIADMLDELEKDESVRVVVFTGNDSGYFSNGFEPSLFLKKSYAENLATCKLVNKTALQYFFFTKPMIACLNGHAMGAGAVFALFSDWRMMLDASARLGFPEALLGMNFPAFVARYMQDLIGVQATRDILFVGKSLKGPEALELGLVDNIFSEETLISETLKFADKLAKSPIQVLQGMKRARTENYVAHFSALSNDDAAELARYVTSPITQEGLLSIVEKRRPRFEPKETKPSLHILKGGDNG